MYSREETVENYEYFCVDYPLSMLYAIQNMMHAIKIRIFLYKKTEPEPSIS
jgi:hypothetical protein